MRTRAKMTLQSLATCYNGGISVKLTPVTGGSEENKTFFSATPSGEVRLDLSQEAARQLGFTTGMLGQEFYLDLTPVMSAR